MPIPFTCPHCGKSMMVDEQYGGQSGPCTACGKSITIPLGAARPDSPRGGSGVGVVIGVVAALVIGGMCVVAILAALLLPAVQTARSAARRSQGQGNLKQIGLALHNYHDVNGRFPPAFVADENGNPLYSWRVLILPYLEQQALYNQFDKTKAWDAPENMAISSVMLDVFRSPADASLSQDGCNYFAIVGPNTIFPGAQSTQIAEVTDGTSNTIMVVEISGIAGSWAAPIDPKFESLTLNIGNNPGELQPIFPNGINVGFADGSTRFLPQTLPPGTLSPLITRNDGTVVPAY